MPPDFISPWFILLPILIGLLLYLALPEVSSSSMETVRIQGVCPNCGSPVSIYPVDFEDYSGEDFLCDDCIVKKSSIVQLNLEWTVRF